jgi:hypothetical protein
VKGIPAVGQIRRLYRRDSREETTVASPDPSPVLVVLHPRDVLEEGNVGDVVQAQCGGLGELPRPLMWTPALDGLMQIQLVEELPPDASRFRLIPCSPHPPFRVTGNTRSGEGRLAGAWRTV